MYRPNSRGGRIDDPPRRRRFRGQYVRRRSPQNGGYGGGASFSDDRNDSPPPPPPNRHIDEPQHFHHHHQPPPPPRNHQRRSRPQPQYSNSYDEDHGGLQAFKVEFRRHDDLLKNVQVEVDSLKAKIDKLILQHDQLETLVKELSVNRGKAQQSQEAPSLPRERDQDERDKRKKQREKKAAKAAERKAQKSATTDQKILNAAEQITTSSDKPAENATGKERVRVLRRKRQPIYRRGVYGNRRRRGESSERNSNDTSPQNEANGTDDQPRTDVRRRSHPKKTYPVLSDAELSEIVQTLNREFFASDKPVSSIKKIINAKGPAVVYEFALYVIENAICNVTSPSKISEIANNLNQLITEESNSELSFRQGFYAALKNIASREDDIAIDAPRYMDTLGQILAECAAPLFPKHKGLARSFLNRCVDSYCEKNRANLLASIFRAVASFKSERFAKDLWDLCGFNWKNLLNQDAELEEFLEAQQVKFTTLVFAPEENRNKKTQEELDKFADDVTSLVERQCQPQTLIELIKEMDCGPEEEVELMGTFIYAVVRGCLATDSGDYKLNSDALNRLASTLNSKRSNQNAIVVRALSALTKLWSQYNCPRDLMTNILFALHNQGTASHEALTTYMNSESLVTIPGIGAARLSAKRCVENLGVNLKTSVS